MQARALLTIQEVAELENSNYETIKKRIQRSNIKAIKVSGSGRCGYEYRIEMEELSEKAKRKYYANLKNAGEMPEEKEKNERLLQMTVENLTEKQRKEMQERKRIIEAWQGYIATAHKQKTEKTKEFIKVWNATNERQLTERTLRRYWEKYREYGEVAIADHRKQSHRKGKTKIPEMAWAVFQQWWLDEAQPCVSTVYRALQDWCSLDMPELLPLPSESSFYNQVKKIPEPMIQYFRYGNKAFEDKCLPYITRTYQDIDSNDVWSSDYHTLDFFVKDDVTGKVFRPHAAVWIDVRSRKVLSVVLCENSNSEGIIRAFRKAVMKYGIPKIVYLDNGREFLVSDFGGRGKRKKDEFAEYGLTILERCGVRMHNAIVQNAKTKIIERVFRTWKYDFSKLVATYCGGRPAERPERLQGMLNADKKIPLLSEIQSQLELYCEYGFNEQGSKAMGMSGKCPNDVYEEQLIVKKTATQEQLNLMMLRSARLQKVLRNGVWLKFGETVMWYYNTELIKNYMNTKVFVRYDTEHLESVRVYDAQEKFIMVAKLSKNGGYSFSLDETGNVDIEAVKENNHRRKEVKKSVLKEMEEMVEVCQAPEMMEVVQRKLEQTKNEVTREYAAKVIQPYQFAQEEMDTQEEVVIDGEKMVRNAVKYLNQA